MPSSRVISVLFAGAFMFAAPGALRAQATTTPPRAAPLAAGDQVRFDLRTTGDPVAQHVAGSVVALRDSAGCVVLQSQGSVPTLMSAFRVAVTAGFHLERRERNPDGSARWRAVDGAALLEAGLTCINGLGEPLGMPMRGS